MSQYNYENITNIYWAASDGFKTGRDPMGVQNSSIATYGKLLPGMTNLTGHIRYYSLYCWLLGAYGNLSEGQHQNLHQYNFIRRAELIMSFIMRGKGLNSVVGSNFIDGNKYKVDSFGAYDIASGADYENKEKYWAYKSGAFGQYYLGSLIHYNLVRVREKGFYLDETGRTLLTAFKNSIPADVRDLYIDRIIQGKLYPHDIKKLNIVGLDAIEINSAEWQELNNLLTKVDTDNNSSLRRESIRLMLNDLKEGVLLDGFVENRFLKYNRKCTEPNAEFGWHFYYLCEMFHYGIETILCYILNKIDNLHNPPINYLLDKATDEICTLFDSESLKTTLDAYLIGVETSPTEVFNELKSHIKKTDYAQAFVTTVKLFCAVYLNFLENKVLTDLFENINDLKRQRGILSTGLKDYVEKYLNTTLKNYVRSLMVQVMNEHSIVAVNKMGYNDYDLRKFIIDDGCAVLIEKRYPNQTNPRIGSLYNFLIDLGYITKDNILTEIGLDFLNSYGN